MGRVKQNGVWLTPEQNKIFMAKRFKDEHGIDLKTPTIEKKSVDPVVDPSDIVDPNAEPVVDQTITEPPAVDESSNGSETPAAPEVSEEQLKEELEAVQKEYEEKIGKLPPRFKNDPVWIKTKLESLGAENV